MKIIIFGAKGYLGQKFLELYPEAICPSLDIADGQAVRAALTEHQPEVVINCAGKTGRPNIDWCEDHKIETIHSNVTGPIVLAEHCAEQGIYLVHVGSGCIYQGDNGGKGYSEDDPPNYYGSFYTRSKIYCDQVLQELNNVLILRLRMPFDKSTHERSLISKIVKYDRVLDTQNSITYLPDFMTAAQTLIEAKATGIYNVVNSGTTSPYQIMQRYQELVDGGHQFERLTLDDLGEVAKTGRSNCVLDTAKLVAAGVTLRPVEDAIDDALEAFKAV